MAEPYNLIFFSSFDILNLTGDLVMKAIDLKLARQHLPELIDEHQEKQ